MTDTRLDLERLAALVQAMTPEQLEADLRARRDAANIDALRNVWPDAVERLNEQHAELVQLRAERLVLDAAIAWRTAEMDPDVDDLDCRTLCVTMCKALDALRAARSKP